MADNQFTDFRLVKWYFDIIDEQGNGVILYTGTLVWKKLSLNYSNRLFFTKNGLVKNLVSFRAGLKVAHEQEKVSVSGKKLNGVWERIHPAITAKLLQSPTGNIDWLCLFPLCKAKVEANGMSLAGNGYAEVLDMTLKPWHFNVDEVYWGRFLSATHHVIWIEWKGSIPGKWLFYNNQRISDFILDETTLVSDAIRLTFHEKITLRSGSLLQTVFKSFPWMRKLFPLKILLTHETKWAAQTTLEVNGEKISGWSIYEKVLWMK